MNWVWASSPTSGNERLVLLALADACSRDDGTGCWPSAATIARKANISDRTVRRVIARLEAEGQVIVHRGGGRAGSTNSYTVVTGDRVIHTPGQNVTPGKLSGGDTGDRPPRTQPCQGTPDTAVSPDPSGNHQGTAARTPMRDAPAPASASQPEDLTVGAFFDAMAGRSDRWRLTAAQRKRLTPAVAAALGSGWTPSRLAELTGATSAGIRNPVAVLAARLSEAGLPPLPARARRQPWCGRCDQRTRLLGFDGDAPGPCPQCKPAMAMHRPHLPESAGSQRDHPAVTRTCAPAARQNRDRTPEWRPALAQIVADRPAVGGVRVSGSVPADGAGQDLGGLGGLPGLDSVREQLAGVIAVIQTEVARRDAGLVVLRLAWKNLVFVGGPGSGKSRTAAAVGRIYRQLGVLSQGHLTEVSSADLAGATGRETGRQVREAASIARGGILMITDADAWAGLQDRDLQVLRGLQEVLTAFRADLAVILAGQGDPLRGLLAASPALASRFPTIIDFPPYTGGQLAAIFAALAGEVGFTLTPAARRKAGAVLGPAAGSSRLAVRMLDQATARQARRITTGAQPSAPADLGTITASDIPDHLPPPDAPDTASKPDQWPGQYL